MFAWPYWEDDPDYSVDRHIDRVTLPEGADQSELEELASRLISSGLDPGKPLWHVTLVENYGSGSAIIARLHHCIADGMSLVQVILTMTEKSAEIEMVSLAGQPSNGIKTIDSNVVGNQPEGKILPSKRRRHHSDYYRRKFRQTKDKISEVVKLLFLPPDSPSILKLPLNPTKHAIWSNHFDLDLLKAIGKQSKASVNDILMSITAGGLNRYLVEKGQSTSRVNLRAFVLFNMRPRKLDDELGNQFGVTFLQLPIHLSDPLDRLNETKQKMDAIKYSSQAGATFWVQSLVGAMPEGLERVVTKILDSKGTVVMTNVPAPQSQLYLGGVPIEMMMAWVPQSGRIGVGLSYISYFGKLVVGLNVDSGVISEPRELLGFMKQEYEILLEKTGISEPV